MADPPYAVFHEVERLIRKAMSRRVRKAVQPAAERVADLAAQQRLDAVAWAAAARRSIDRMALVACGAAASVVDQIVGPPGSPKRLTMTDDLRARRLLAFALSAEYLALRRKLGMGVA